MVTTVSSGTLLSRTFSLFAAGSVPFLSIAFLVYSPLFVARLFFAATDSLPDWWLFIESLAPVVMGPIAAAALVFGVFRSLRGEQVTVNDCLRVGFSRWLPVLWASILVGLATMGGAIFCLVPGIVVACGLFVAVPALVVEKMPAIAALNRSWRLTDGYKLAIFGVLLVLLVIGMAAGVVLGLLSGGEFGEPSPSLTVAMMNLLITVVTATIQGIAAGVAYHDLRIFREGLGEEELAAVFD